MHDQLPLSHYERILSQGPLPYVQRSVLAGTSRSLRISHDRTKEREKAIKEVSAGLIGPLAFMFVWWVLSEAKKSGIQRLYFLARDGQLLFKVAGALVKEWGLDIEVRYIYCSRESLLLPSFQQVGPFEENWITWGYLSSITLEEICSRLELTIDDLSPLLSEVGLSHYTKDATCPISSEDKHRLHGLLQREDFSALVREKASSRSETTLGYFVQEGFADNIKFAVVDTGWRASSQYALSALLEKGKLRTSEGLTGFYLGINKDVHRFRSDTLRAFLFDWRSEPRDDRLYNFICFEMLFSADHGRTIGYRSDGNNYSPVIQDVVEPLIQSDVSLQHKIAVEYARRAATVLPFNDFKSESVKVCRKLAREFICSPSLEIAEVYGNWPMASEIRERDHQVMAPPMDFWAFFSRALGHKKVVGFWPQASLIRGHQRLLNFVYNMFLSSGLLEWYRRVILRY